MSQFRKEIRLAVSSANALQTDRYRTTALYFETNSAFRR